MESAYSWFKCGLFAARVQRFISSDLGGFATSPFRKWVSSLVPESISMPDWLNSHFLPPLLFITGAMKCAVMRGAEGNHPLVTHLATKGTGLGKTQMVRMAWRSATDETRL